METLKSLDRSPVARAYHVLESRHWRNGFYVKVEAQVADGSVLHVREYVDEEERQYSYHWQSSSGDMIIRWDNSQHHRELDTYPDHKHVGNDTLPSRESTLSDVLAVIEAQIAL